MQLQGNLSVERMCHLGRVSRAGFYRYLKGSAPRVEKTEVRSMVQQIALEHRRRLGSPRITRALRGCDMDAPTLRPGQEPLPFREARRLDVVEGGADVVEEGVGHSASFRSRVGRQP